MLNLIITYTPEFKVTFEAKKDYRQNVAAYLHR
jgi:hypothetical protein